MKTKLPGSRHPGNHDADDHRLTGSKTPANPLSPDSLEPADQARAGCQGVPPPAAHQVGHPPMSRSGAGNRAGGQSNPGAPGAIQAVVSRDAQVGRSTRGPLALSRNNAGCRKPAPGMALTPHLKPPALKGEVAPRRAGGHAGNKPSQVASLNNPNGSRSVGSRPLPRLGRASPNRPQALHRLRPGRGQPSRPGNRPGATGLGQRRPNLA